MLSPLRNRFGIPGVISVIALVFAMLGGAYAATRSDSGKATASAKAKRGPRGPKGPAGPAGPAGPVGPVGPAGAQGAAGADGKEGPQGKQGIQGVPGTPGSPGAPGAPGDDGKSVELVGTFTGPEETPPNAGPCNGAGGSEYEVEESGTVNIVCNGEPGAQGSPWAAGGVLPPSSDPNCPEVKFGTGVNGCSETGTFAFNGTSADAEGVWVPISFPISLEGPLFGEEGQIHFVTGEEISNSTKPPECPGFDGAPTALPGNFCIYEGRNPGFINADFEGVFRPGTTEYPIFPEEWAAGITGAILHFTITGAVGRGAGSWAVTAP
jgi:Collagen triple helix repeat (20 copies)